MLQANHSVDLFPSRPPECSLYVGPGVPHVSLRITSGGGGLITALIRRMRPGCESAVRRRFLSVGTRRKRRLRVIVATFDLQG